MKREEIEALLKDFTPEKSKAVIDSVMALNGADIETEKGKITPLETERDTFKAQLETAQGIITGYKGMKPEEIQASITKYQDEAKQAKADGEAAVELVKVRGAVELALLKDYAAINPARVITSIDLGKIKFGKDGKLEGLKEQVDPVKEAESYLFGKTPESGQDQQNNQQKPPRIVGKTTPPASTVFTLEQVKSMTQAEINANWAEVQKVLAQPAQTVEATK